MSDMNVVELASSPKSETLAVVAQTLVEEELKDNIVFVPPTESTTQSQDESTPPVDSQGRHRWIRTRQCFCPDDAPTDCRFHKEWTKCPHEPKYKYEGDPRFAPKSRWLWATNPEFMKPIQRIEAEIEAENEQVVEEIAA